MMAGKRRLLTLTGAGAAALIVAYLAIGNGQNGKRPTDGLATVTVPELSRAALAGEASYKANCSSCHGVNAAGRDGIGPPLVHKIYEPSHHGDMAFVLAAKQGVRQHHWSFGNMPPVEGITDDEIGDIISYVRTLQRANGIQ